MEPPAGNDAVGIIDLRDGHSAAAPRILARQDRQETVGAHVKTGVARPKEFECEPRGNQATDLIVVKWDLCPGRRNVILAEADRLFDATSCVFLRRGAAPPW